jgi:hypothetical protein
VAHDVVQLARNIAILAGERRLVVRAKHASIDCFAMRNEMFAQFIERLKVDCTAYENTQHPIVSPVDFVLQQRDRFAGLSILTSHCLCGVDGALLQRIAKVDLEAIPMIWHDVFEALGIRCEVVLDTGYLTPAS